MLRLLLCALLLSWPLSGCFRYLDLDRGTSADAAADAGTDSQRGDAAIDGASRDHTPGEATAGDGPVPDRPLLDAAAPDAPTADGPLPDVTIPDGPLPDTLPPRPTLPSCPAPPTPKDTSSPTTVVGTGTAASCTEAALAAAVAQGGIITFNCGTAPHTITLKSELVVTQDTVIDGNGLVTLDGANKTRILYVKSYSTTAKPTLVVQSLTLTRGLAADNGGAIYRQGGTLEVLGCTFTDNHAIQSSGTQGGGAISADGMGPTAIVKSSFTGNSAANGGAIRVMGSTLGGPLQVHSSTITGNQATGSGGAGATGGQGGGIMLNGSSMTLCDTVITNNTAGTFGGGVFRVPGVAGAPTLIKGCIVKGNQNLGGQGGGLYLQGTAVALANSEISGNSGGGGGGMFLGPGNTADLINVTVANNKASAMGGGLFIVTGVTGTLLNCTVAGNQASFGAGLQGGHPGLWLVNSIVANSTATNIWESLSCKGQLDEGGGNFQYPKNKASGGADSLCSASVTLADPQLGPLADNGGATQTMAPAAGSPVIGKGVDCPPIDQRGVSRGSPCTSGAHEVSP